MAVCLDKFRSTLYGASGSNKCTGPKTRALPKAMGNFDVRFTFDAGDVIDAAFGDTAFADAAFTDAAFADAAVCASARAARSASSSSSSSSSFLESELSSSPMRRVRVDLAHDTLGQRRRHGGTAVLVTPQQNHRGHKLKLREHLVAVDVRDRAAGQDRALLDLVLQKVRHALREGQNAAAIVVDFREYVFEFVQVKCVP